MSAAAHIAIIDPCLKHPELDTFNRLAADFRDLPLSYHQPAMFGISSLRDREDAMRGIVVLGSAASVHDNAAWQKTFDPWLQQQINKGLPILGICYGHQLLAKLLGGDVGYAFPAQKKEQGWRPLTLNPCRLWPVPQQGQLVISHAEMVSRLPPSCSIICSSPSVPIEAFEHESLPVWGIQAHPEATNAFMINQNIPDLRPDAAFVFGHTLVRQFLRTCC